MDCGLVWLSAISLHVMKDSRSHWIAYKTSQANSALHPSGFTKSSTSFGWGKDRKVTAARWQVTLWFHMACDFRIRVMISLRNCHIQFTLLQYLFYILAAARLITRTGRQEHISPVLHQLHWLPVCQRVNFSVGCAYIQGATRPTFSVSLWRLSANDWYCLPIIAFS